MPVVPHRLLREIPKLLKVSAEWTEHTPEGTAFVVTETGCWMSLHEDVLHVEVRAALGVADQSTAAAFCDDRNHLALLGRWCYDAATQAVALVADLRLDAISDGDAVSASTELVAELINAVATVQYKGAVQRDLHARKAVPALRGKIRGSRNRTGEHLPAITYPRGRNPDVAQQALILTQDVLVPALPDWSVEHHEHKTVAQHDDGSRLLIQVAQHPHAGWGLVVTLMPSWTGDPMSLNDRNAADGVGLGRWATVHDWIEHRTFLPTALLETLTSDAFAPSRLVLAVVNALCAQRDGVPLAGNAVHRAVWPGDDLTVDQTRREPFNDAREEDDPEWYAIYLDTFGRMGTLTEPSYREWLAQLTDEDKSEPRTAGFISFMEDRIEDRRRRETPG